MRTCININGSIVIPIGRQRRFISITLSYSSSVQYTIAYAYPVRAPDSHHTRGRYSCACFKQPFGAATTIKALRDVDRNDCTAELCQTVFGMRLSFCVRRFSEMCQLGFSEAVSWWKFGASATSLCNRAVCDMRMNINDSTLKIHVRRGES